MRGDAKILSLMSWIQVPDGEYQANRSFFHCDNATLVSSRQMDEELREQEHYRRGDEAEERDVELGSALRRKKAPRPGAYPQGFSSFVMTSPQRPQVIVYLRTCFDWMHDFTCLQHHVLHDVVFIAVLPSSMKDLPCSRQR